MRFVAYLNGIDASTKRFHVNLQPAVSNTFKDALPQRIKQADLLIAFADYVQHIRNRVRIDAYRFCQLIIINTSGYLIGELIAFAESKKAAQENASQAQSQSQDKPQPQTQQRSSAPSTPPQDSVDGFMYIPDNVPDELPFS